MAKTNTNQPATKGDISNLRSELKADIKLLDQKLDRKVGALDQKTTTLGVELAKTQLRIDRLENNVITEIRSFKSELLSAFEASVVKGRMYEQKAVTHGGILATHEEKLLNHETRLATLETK
ncbi:MAG: hypothetical protein A2X28_05735 [Elusimicrobia bacterium GWA2_56_46]|nr:MAG: hypothetical protein A2X28_05735 [Elusimicrobia bacterium GWA2_56_46]OGR56020.1 MAG: hypothetical protein A2X39_03165 [Elusimicrobia bacterium GWC2_56_31]HBW23241.1 hypothetical protein [Elusimicrobiota bacterium]